MSKLQSFVNICPHFHDLRTFGIKQHCFLFQLQLLPTLCVCVCVCFNILIEHAPLPWGNTTCCCYTNQILLQGMRWLASPNVGSHRIPFTIIYSCVCVCVRARARVCARVCACVRVRVCMWYKLTTIMQHSSLILHVCTQLPPPTLPYPFQLYSVETCYK